MRWGINTRLLLFGLSCVWLFMTLWTAARQTSLSMGFPLRQEYCSVLPFPSPGDLPDLGMNPCFLYWQEDSLPLGHLGSPWHKIVWTKKNNRTRAELGKRSILYCKQTLGTSSLAFFGFVLKNVIWVTINKDNGRREEAPMEMVRCLSFYNSSSCFGNSWILRETFFPAFFPRK